MRRGCLAVLYQRKHYRSPLPNRIMTQPESESRRRLSAGPRNEAKSFLILTYIIRSIRVHCPQEAIPGLELSTKKTHRYISRLLARPILGPPELLQTVYVFKPHILVKSLSKLTDNSFTNSTLPHQSVSGKGPDSLNGLISEKVPTEIAFRVH